MYLALAKMTNDPKFVLNPIDETSYVVVPFNKEDYEANRPWYSGSTFIDSPEDVKHIRHLIIN
jgi:hypothetical protein